MDDAQFYPLYYQGEAPDTMADEMTAEEIRERAEDEIAQEVKHED